MSETPRVDAKIAETDLAGVSSAWKLDHMTDLADTLERELNKANAIIAAALAYVEEFKEFFPEETLIAILEDRMPAINKKEEG